MVEHNKFLAVLLFVLILSPIGFVIAAELFSDGYESGDFSVWTGTQINDGTITVTSDWAHDGTYSAIAEDCVGGSDQAFSYYVFPTAEAYVYMRWYINVTSIPSSTGVNDKLEFGGFYNDPAGVISRLVYDVSESKWGAQYYDGGFQDVLESGTTTLSLNTEYCVELYTRIHNTQGNVSMWLDGTMKATAASLDTDDRGSVEMAGIGVWYYQGHLNGEFAVHVDCCVMDDANYIGPEADGLQEFTFEFLEHVNITDSMTRQREKAYHATEYLNITEQSWMGREKSVILTEFLNASETLTMLRELSIELLETIGLESILDVIEELFVALDITIEFLETIGLEDTMEFGKESIVEIIEVLEETLNIEATMYKTPLPVVEEAVADLAIVALAIALFAVVMVFDVSRQRQTQRL